MTKNTTKAEVGDVIRVRNLACRITKIHDFGTIDCISLCGQFAYRVSGIVGLTAINNQQAVY